MQTHNQMEFGALLCLFAFICVLLSRVRQEWLRDEYLFVCLSLFVFVYSIRMLLILQTAFSYWNKEKKNTEISQNFCILRKIHRQDKTTEGKTNWKEKKKKTVTTEQVMRCTRNVFVYGRFRKSPLPIRRSSMGWSFPFSCTWMPHNRMRNDNGMTGGGGTGIAIGTPHFGTWKAWESNNWIGHLDIIFKTKIMTTQQCNPGLCSNKMLRF